VLHRLGQAHQVRLADLQSQPGRLRRFALAVRTGLAARRLARRVGSLHRLGRQYGAGSQYQAGGKKTAENRRMHQASVHGITPE
jgi:hypothetical protein